MATARQQQLLDQGPDQFRFNGGHVPRSLPGTVDAFADSNAGTTSVGPALARQLSRCEGTTLALDSDLSSKVEVCDRELEAIARLLGDDLVRFLAEG